MPNVPRRPDPVQTPEPPSEAPSINHATLRNRSFVDRLGHPLLWMQFFSLLNDHSLKQLSLLLLLQRQTARDGWFDLQGVALVVFALPFLTLGRIAGGSIDRGSPMRLLVIWKAVEIIWMLLVGALYLLHPQPPALWVLIALAGMAVQSAFLTPAKYATLLQLFPHDEVLRRNGQMQTVGYLAILAGSGGAGWFVSGGRVAGASLASTLVGVAVAGWVCSIGVSHASATPKRQPIASPAADGDTATAAQTVWRIPSLRFVMVAYATLWWIAGMYHPTINAFCVDSLGLSGLQTGGMLAVSVVGIATGCWVAGHRPRSAALSPTVALGLIVSQSILVAVVIAGPETDPLLFAGLLFAMGWWTGLIVLPLHVSIQTLAPENQRGRVLAFQQWMNWAAILAAGLWFALTARLWGDHPRHGFAVITVLTTFALVAGIAWQRRTNGIG